MTFLILPLTAQAEEFEVAATMIFRDEAPYLKEWIEYHKLIGVEHFFLYNHLSQDNFREVLQPYIENNEVELTDCVHRVGSLDEWDSLQKFLITDGLRRSKGRTKWLLILDSDEFFVPIHHDSIADYLKRYDHPAVGAVVGTIIVFGTSGVEKIPDDQLLIETLVTAMGTNSLWKSAVKVASVTTVGNPHTMNLAPGCGMVRAPLDELQINHYWSRDRHYLYNFKIPRRAEWGTPADTCVRWAEGGSHTPEFALPILRFIEPLRQLMGLDERRLARTGIEPATQGFSVLCSTD
jgi:Glycosyltransferase family 92